MSEILEHTVPAAAETAPEETAVSYISFDDFCKVKMIAVKVKNCVKVKKSELLCFTLDDGSGTERQILSRIAKFYDPETLVGKTLAAVVNLAPRTMKGLESCGMLLSAECGDSYKLVMLADEVPAGAEIC